jgi:glycosyltransferase involved in cell wall biosynthesis
LRARSVEVTGFVEDLGDVYRRTRVAVAPLRCGGGIKFKVAAAMAHGLPVVATEVAAGGYEDAAANGCLTVVRADGTDFARAVVNHLRSGPGAALEGKRAHQWISEHFDFDGGMAAILDEYELLLRAEDRA